MCGAPATLRCARWRRVWYCGPKCQRAAWGAQVSVRGGGGGGGGDGGCGARARTRARRLRAAAVVVWLRLLHRASRMLEGAAARRACRRRPCATASAVAMLASRKPQERAAGARALVNIVTMQILTTTASYLSRWPRPARRHPRARGRRFCFCWGGGLVVSFLAQNSMRGCDCSGMWYSSSRRASCVAVDWRAGGCCARTRQPGHECREQGHDRIGR